MEKYRKKNDILNPLSVVLKLFIYSYKPIGTKISISCNRILIQEPGIFQGTVRIFLGDCKNDINILTFPILYACVKYLTGEPKLKFVPIFKRVLLSFEVMKETYHGNEIIYSIGSLETIVSTFLHANETVDPTSMVLTYASPGGRIKQNMYNHLNSLWTAERMAVVFGILQEIMNPASVEIGVSLLNALNQYLASLDLMTSHLLSAI